jgi:hypothetical protein
MQDPKSGFYRVKVEERESGDGTIRQVLVLRVFRDGVETETLDFELTPSGSRELIDEVGWLEFRYGPTR